VEALRRGRAERETRVDRRQDAQLLEARQDGEGPGLGQREL
jgi:hypothetical protein